MLPLAYSVWLKPVTCQPLLVQAQWLFTVATVSAHFDLASETWDQVHRCIPDPEKKLVRIDGKETKIL